jgi:hypothetical protein
MARPVSSRVVRGEEAYLYAFKSRAKRHHCIAYGTGSVDIGELSRLYRRQKQQPGLNSYTSLACGRRRCRDEWLDAGLRRELGHGCRCGCRRCFVGRAC